MFKKDWRKKKLKIKYFKKNFNFFFINILFLKKKWIKFKRKNLGKGKKVLWNSLKTFIFLKNFFKGKYFKTNILVNFFF